MGSTLVHTNMAFTPMFTQAASRGVLLLVGPSLAVLQSPRPLLTCMWAVRDRGGKVRGLLVWEKLNMKGSHNSLLS